MTDLAWYDNPEELSRRLDAVGNNAAELARIEGVPVDRIKRRRASFGLSTLHEVPRSATVRYSREPMWGLGGPQLIGPSTNDSDERVVGIFDVHWPYQEPRLFEQFLQFIRDYQPHLIVVGGDIYDNGILSRWEAQKRAKISPGRMFQLVQNDLNTAKAEFWERIREAAPDAVIRFIEGNHDDRLRHWLIDDDLADGVEMAKEWMGLDEFGVHWHPRCGFLLRPEFLIRHGEVLTIHAAKGEYDRTKCGGWFGHGHRRSTWYEYLPETNRSYAVHMAPVMSRLDYDYGQGQSGLAKWPQGFLVGTFSTTDQYDYESDVARYWNGRLLIHGRRYE